MLSSFERGVIILINNALKAQNTPLPEDFDYSRLYEFAKSQQIMPLIYYGGRDLQEFVSHDEKRKIYASAMFLALLNQNQESELETLCLAFEKNGVDYMRLKGSVIKRLYPCSEMRLLGDADVLIRKEQMGRIELLMETLGYKHLLTSDHEWVWKKGDLGIELHKRIIPSYTKDLYAYFGDGWDHAQKVADGGHEYTLSAENELIYLVSHFTKHYRYAGIGIKHLVDIHVLLEANADIDHEYVHATLEQLGIAEFYKNIVKTLDVWFKDAEGDEVTDFITQKVFSGGVYGTTKDRSRYEAAALANGADADKVRKKRFWSAVFPSFKTMCEDRPWLRKCPILLPFAWAGRLVTVLLFRRDHIRRERESISAINASEIESYKAELKLVGLDFNFEV